MKNQTPTTETALTTLFAEIMAMPDATPKFTVPDFTEPVTAFLEDFRIGEDLPLDDIGDGESDGDYYTFVYDVRPSGVVALYAYYDDRAVGDGPMYLLGWVRLDGVWVENPVGNAETVDRGSRIATGVVRKSLRPCLR